MGLSRVRNYDIWFHMSAGMHILETAEIKHSTDPFSFTSTNPMSTSSWLAGIVFYKIYSLLGVEGLVIFKALVITLVFLIFYHNMRLISSSEFPLSKYVFILVLMLSAFAIRMRMFVRPFIFEFLLLALYIFILNLYKFKKKNLLYLLPLLQVFLGERPSKPYYGHCATFPVFCRRGC